MALDLALDRGCKAALISASGKDQDLYTTVEGVDEYHTSSADTCIDLSADSCGRNSCPTISQGSDRKLMMDYDDEIERISKTGNRKSAKQSQKHSESGENWIRFC